MFRFILIGIVGLLFVSTTVLLGNAGLGGCRGSASSGVDGTEEETAENTAVFSGKIVAPGEED
jgi:hypothetical protein